MKIAATFDEIKILAFCAAFLFFGIRAYIWQKLLCKVPLSTIYPFASLVQVLILIYALVIFKENISINQLFGLFIMMLGLFIMFSDKKQL